MMKYGVPWRQRILEALRVKGGEASNEEIYTYIAANWPSDFLSFGLTDNQKANVRAEIQRHSTDSVSFEQGNDDLFYSVQGIGAGVWGLTALGAQQAGIAPTGLATSVAPNSFVSPQRTTVSILRVIRDSRSVLRLKELYGQRCQICGSTIAIGNAQHYSEGHHFWPLGSPHNGPDIQSNILIVCPTHHVELDYGVLAIEPSSYKIIHKDPSYPYLGNTLTTDPKHRLGDTYLQYHFNQIFQPKSFP